jgi:hypothetical protein
LAERSEDNPWLSDRVINLNPYGGYKKMDINVKFNDIYKEVIIKEGNSTVETGLLDKHEALEMGIGFIRAAYDLLPDSELRDKLIEIEEGL